MLTSNGFLGYSIPTIVSRYFIIDVGGLSLLDILLLLIVLLLRTSFTSTPLSSPQAKIQNQLQYYYYSTPCQSFYSMLPSHVPVDSLQQPCKVRISITFTGEMGRLGFREVTQLTQSHTVDGKRRTGILVCLTPMSMICSMILRPAGSKGSFITCALGGDWIIPSSM